MTCLVLLLPVLVSDALTHAADSTFSIPQSFATTEPITPIPPAPEIDPLKLALGERLFTDTRLSRGGTFSCATCHDVRTNGADSEVHDRDADGLEIPLNTTTVFNAALNFRLNWEGNVRTLEAQAAAAFENPGFMGTSIEEVLGKLRSDAEMNDLFNHIYGHGPDRDSLLDAIASYERSLLTPGSRFDLWLRGDATALSVDEQNGYKLFKSLGCISCHQGVNIGGNLFQRHGIFRPLAAAKPEILRVPSLRNVATTPPYFHDGSAPTLNSAVRRMATAQLNRTLTDQQADLIVAFLRSLTGTYRGVPVIAATR
ncbi:MAG TPA: cytochrome c peroxidase [Terriglobia bacterium]|nr:cytochrome c peroxidase [Terriglobia bacterium]